VDEPLQAHTLNEVRYYLMVTPCQACGKGPWEVLTPNGTAAAEPVGLARARCRHCGAEREFRFRCDAPSPTHGVEAETINPTDEPSRIVDLGEWLSLFYLLIEAAASQESKPATRREGYRAALCLAEALKFYGDDELPPASAFFSERSAAAYRQHPESFARQRLRDMQAKLPKLDAMHRRLQREDRGGRRGWWRFWRR
jgi:hypothetical protein